MIPRSIIRAVLALITAPLLPTIAMVGDGPLPPRVAVLGSGVSGSTAARLLADAGISVTVFECGFGVGGRTATRITRDERFAFDHGAQYIGSPKTNSFREALVEWEESGFVREWEGRFADVAAAAPSSDSSDGPNVALDDPTKKHYVGYPAMNSICTNLLRHENIRVVLQTRACATFDDEADPSNSECWSLTSHGDGRNLGKFDWLLCGDRLSATNNRADLRDAPVSPAFRAQIDPIASVPILVLMVAFESPLPGLAYDGIKFEEGGDFGSLGWAARDTSKPGRERPDGRECWVVQSGPKAAQRVMASIEGAPDFEGRREKVREEAKELLLSDFLSAISRLAQSQADGAATSIPNIVAAVGHRWSAAFPLVPPPGEAYLAGESVEYSIDAAHNFIACGDYFGKLTGRVESAYLSGRAAASSITHALAKENTK